MKKAIHSFLLFILFTLLITSCSKKVKSREDNLYSRHLQEHFKLTIISTELPEVKQDMNLIIFNDGQDMEQLRMKEVIDSLYSEKLILPVIVVAVHANKRMEEYGVSDRADYQNRGNKANKYDEFINNELYPYIKKNTGVRKFKSVTIAGCSLGGLSAFDIAWNHSDKIDKVGVFSGSFWWRDKDAAAPDYNDNENRIMLSKIRSSRKKPGLKYWFYVGDKEEDSDRDHDGIIDAVDDTKDLIQLLQSKNICSTDDIAYKELAGGKHEYAYWRCILPDFLIWAVGK